MFTQELDRMEEVMLGSKRTAPLWRKRHPRRLALERALAPGKPARDTEVEQAVISEKAEQRRVDEAKRRMRFSEAD